MDSYCWTWTVAGGKPQTEVFPTPDQALQAMSKRLGKEASLNELWEMGMALALVTVDVHVHMVLQPITPEELPMESEGLNS